MSLILTKICSIPPKHLFPRAIIYIKRKFKAVKLKYRDKIFGSIITDHKFIHKTGCKYKKDFLNLMQDWRIQGPNIISEFCPESKWKGWSKIYKLNQQALNHEFDLLGSGLKKISYNMQLDNNLKYYKQKSAFTIKKIILTKIKDRTHIDNKENYEPIDWNLDFRSGFRWLNETWYMDIPIGQLPGVDIKIPWELSRFYHLPRLGLEYYQNQTKEKLAKEFVLQITDWIVSNPARYGPNWRTSMEVAIRVSNWLLAFDFFKNSKYITSDFLIMFSKSLYQHGSHIMNNIEKHQLSGGNNHYIANIAGIVFLVFGCPWLPDRQKWHDFAVDELISETNKQFLKDGGNFEGSTLYHRLSLEMVLHATILILNYKMRGETDLQLEKKKYMNSELVFSKDYMNRIFNGLLFTTELMKDNHFVPQFGDNDSGRFFNLYPPESDFDHRHLIALGTKVFNYRKFKNLCGSWDQEASIYFKISGKDHQPISCIKDQVKKNKLQLDGLKYFSESGIAVIKKDLMYLAVILRPSFGGHSHNDLFSFELRVDGEDFIVDGGSYCYTPFPDIRNKFRSTFAHNTLMHDKKEQNYFGSLFELIPRSKPSINEITQNLISVTHQAYERTHKRIFKFDRNKTTVFDYFNGNSTCQLNLASGVVWEDRNYGIHLEKNGKRIEIELNNFKNVRSRQGFLSLGYGKRSTNEILILKRVNQETSMQFRW